MNLYQTKDVINEKVGKDLLLMKLPFISFFFYISIFAAMQTLWFRSLEMTIVGL